MSEDRITRRSLLRGMAVGGTATAIGAGTAGGTEQDRYIIDTKDVAGAGAAKEKTAQVHREFDFGHVGNAVSGRFPEEAREPLEQRPDVRYIERDGRMRAIGQSLEWGVDRVDADLVHDSGVTGEGADIAILDTGIDPDHPDLEANLGTGKAFYDCGTNVDGSSCSTSSDCTEPWADDNDHGTHCAGIAAAVDNARGVIGVAPSATLHAVRVLDCSAWGYYSEMAAGLEYVVDQGWDVASMSLGGRNSSSTLQDACQYAADNGVLVVAAAGNAGPCSDCVRYPAAYDSVVAVSATESGDGLASFSSTGPEIELAAPGQYITSTVRGGTESWAGTSMACPHVSGAAGLLMANGYSAAEARSRLGSTAEDIGLGDNEQGKGLVDTEAALGSSSGDTTAPSAPSNLSSPAHTDTTIDLNWDTASDDGSGVDHYNVYLGGSKTTQTTNTSVILEGLSAGTSYDIYVTAVDGAGNESDTSDTLTVTTLSVIGETGRLVTDQSGDSDWHTVSLTNSYTDPVVIMNPLSYNGGHPSHARLRNVGSDSFEFQIEEWNYLDQWHTEETVSYMVLEHGTHALPDGTSVEAGTLDTRLSFRSVSFSREFSSPPVVLSTVQTYNGPHAVVTRQRNVSTSGLKIRLQEEEAESWHTRESVGYVAIEPTAGTNDGTAFEAGTTGTTVNNGWHTIPFEQSYSSSPVFLSQIQTFEGTHPCGLRYRNLDSTDVEVFIEEEQSSDSEMWHTNENVGYLTLGGEATLYTK